MGGPDVSATPFGDSKLESLFAGDITAGLTGRIRYATEQQDTDRNARADAMHVRAPGMQATGTLIRSTKVRDGDYDFGFVQNLWKSGAVATYSSAGKAVRKLVLTWPTPMIDTDGAKVPWALTTSWASVAGSTYEVKFGDQPDFNLFWRNTDYAAEQGKPAGVLSSLTGTDEFLLWLVVIRKNDARRFWCLRYVKWQVNWSSTFDLTSFSGKVSGDGGGKIIAEGGFIGPQGPPKFTGTTANKSVKREWKNP